MPDYELQSSQSDCDASAKTPAASAPVPMLHQVAAAAGGPKRLSINYGNLLETFLQVTTLCMAIAATSSSAVTFADAVTPGQIASFGARSFAIAKGVLVFYPLLYVPWLFLVLNNAASIATYHEFAEEGTLVAFPDTGNVRFALTHNLSFFFVVSFIFYITYGGVLFIHFGTPFNVGIVWAKQLVMELVLFYFTLLSVDPGLLSLKEFVSRHDDRPGHEGHPVVDAYTLARASDNLRTFTCVRSEAPYLPYTAHYRRHRDVSRAQLFLYGQYALMVCGLVGVGYFQYQLDQRDAQRDSWASVVTPCVQVCVDRATAGGGGGGGGGVCRDCVCACLSAAKIDVGAEACAAYLNVPACSEPEDRVCAGLGEAYCAN